MNYFLDYRQLEEFHLRAIHILFQNFLLVKCHDIAHIIFLMDIFYHNLEFLMLEYRLPLNFYRKFEHSDCDCHRFGRVQRIHMMNTAVDEAIAKK